MDAVELAQANAQHILSHPERYREGPALDCRCGGGPAILRTFAPLDQPTAPGLWLLSAGDATPPPGNPTVAPRAGSPGSPDGLLWAACPSCDHVTICRFADGEIHCERTEQAGVEARAATSWSGIEHGQWVSYDGAAEVVARTFQVVCPIHDGRNGEPAGVMYEVWESEGGQRYVSPGTWQTQNIAPMLDAEATDRARAIGLTAADAPPDAGDQPHLRVKLACPRATCPTRPTYRQETLDAFVDRGLAGMATLGLAELAVPFDTQKSS